MAELPPIAVVILIIVVAFALVLALTILRWPTIPAYFIAGVGVGPSGLGVLHNSETAHFIAELGVIFLLFTIGLKFSLSGLRVIRRHVFWLGGAQTSLTAALFGIPAWLWTGDLLLALLVGSVAAMSSTAVVSQILIDENIVASPVGGRSMGVLLFQDLAVIPLIIIFSTGVAGASMLQTVGEVGIKVALIMVLVLFAGAPLMTRWLNMVAGYGGKELYMLNLVMLIGVLSGLSAWGGLSYALGAFVAGILMSETMHRYRVSRLVEPLRHIFLGFFFVSLGILVDLDYLAANWLLAMAAAALLLAIKGPLVYACARMLGTHPKTAICAALLLCGAGEFGFVLLTLARSSNVVTDEIFQLLLSANLIALVVVPFLWKGRHRFTQALAAREWLTDAKKMTENIQQTQGLSGHIVICGFGRTGQAIAAIARDLSLPYVALEEDYRILEAAGGADNVIYAEAASPNGLLGAGIRRARAVVVSFVDAVDSKTAVQRAREINPSLFIIARADTPGMADELSGAGADRVYVDAFEFGFSAAKRLGEEIYAAPAAAISLAIRRARKKENPFFTGEYGGDLSKPDDEHAFLGCVAGRDIPALNAEIEDCHVISWLRDGEIMDTKNTGLPARSGDEFVIRGPLNSLLSVKQRIENSATE